MTDEQRKARGQRAAQLNDEFLRPIFAGTLLLAAAAVSAQTTRIVVPFNAGGATDFCARFLDGEDRPVTNLRVDLGLR